MNTRDPVHFSVAQRCNSELAVRALRHGAGVAFHRPTQVYLQLASACNLSCTMCSEANRPEDARFGKGLISFSPELFARLEREVFPWSSELYFGVGGEPTFSEHFVDYVERAARANQEIHLVTNGTYLERDAVAAAVAERIAYVQVSIDAATAATYERIRVGSRWKRLLAGLEKLAALRAASGRDGSLSLCFVLMRSNVHELPAFVELAASLGADAVHAQHVITMTDASVGESLVGEPERYDRFRAAAAVRALELGIAFDAPEPFEGAPSATPPPRDPDLVGYKVPCRSPNQTAVILYDGRVFACCHPLAHEKMQLGDLRTQSFEEIWNGRAARNLRAGMKSGDVPTICRTCSIVHSPPPIAEIADVAQGAQADGALATSPGLAAYYGERELDPLPSGGASRAALAEYVGDLRRHADALGSEREQLLAHAATLQRERDALARHAAVLEHERAHLARHVANLEAERPPLFRHVANLEAERHVLRARIERTEDRFRRIGLGPFLRRRALAAEGASIPRTGDAAAAPEEA